MSVPVVLQQTMVFRPETPLFAARLSFALCRFAQSTDTQAGQRAEVFIVYGVT